MADGPVDFALQTEAAAAPAPLADLEQRDMWPHSAFGVLTVEIVSKAWPSLSRRAAGRGLPVQLTAQEAEQTLREEDDGEHEDHPDRDQVVLGEVARETLAQQEEDRRA